MTKQVMEQALEALTYHAEAHTSNIMAYQLRDKAIAALKEAIKQAGEPVAWYDPVSGLSHTKRDKWHTVPLYTSAQTIPDVDWLASVIRSVDGNHTLGAGALAEKIVEAMSAAPSYQGDKP